MFIINVHALHRNHGISNCISFWIDTYEKILQYVPKLSNMILLGYFNTKLGGEISDCIGSFQLMYLYKVGKALHRYLPKLKLTIPCTFSDHFKGDLTHTFTFHSGSTHRIDFIAAPLASMAYDNVASTLEVPASHLGDHRAATLSTSLVFHNVKGNSPARYDPLKFGDPHASEGFNHEISLGSFFAPFLNNSSRLHYFNTFVNFALIKWFPADCRSVRHSHISDYTRACVKNYRNQTA